MIFSMTPATTDYFLARINEPSSQTNCDVHNHILRLETEKIWINPMITGKCFLSFLEAHHLQPERFSENNRRGLWNEI